jgi:hypothetical protein
VICLHEKFGPQRALITMTSTQLKKARKWITQAQGLTAKGKNGIYTLPLMSQVYNLTTVQEQNDKGTWFGWEIQREGALDLKKEEDNNVFQMGYSFAQSVKAGEVEVKSEVPTDEKLEKDDIPF